MGVDVAHLVLVALRHTGDQVLDERLDGAESSNALADAMVEDNLNLGGALLDEGDVDVLEVLYELSPGAGDGDLASLDRDGDW